MKTSEAIANGYRCPECGAVMSEDKAGQGFVRHPWPSKCTYGHGERDEPDTKPLLKTAIETPIPPEKSPEDTARKWAEVMKKFGHRFVSKHVIKAKTDTP